MNQEFYAPPESDISTSEDADQAPELWNPDSAGALSIFFSPVFGSFLVMKNWQAIADEKRIKRSKIWFGLSVFMLIPNLIIPGVGFLYLIIWYFSSQKRQSIYIKKKWSNMYPKKGWGLPFLYAMLIAVPVYALSFFLQGLLF